MAKRSQRHPSQHERDQAGCIWGLISIFDFRHGRSTRRLLADRRRVSKQPVGARYSSNQTIVLGPAEKSEIIVNAEESKMPLADVAKTSVKELMEEEIVNEQGSESQPNDSEIGLGRRNSDCGNHLKKYQKKRSRSRMKSGDMDVSDLDAAECLKPENSNQVTQQRPSDNLNLKKIMEELAQINQRNTNCSIGDLDSQAVTVVEEKLFAAVQLFVEQSLSGSRRSGEEGNRCHSKEFMDVLQTLSLNKGLFLKLLEDPNFKLDKHVQNLEDGQTPCSLPASSLLEQKPINLKIDEFSGRRQRNFFRRRSRSLESCPLVGEKDFQSANEVVILKPGPAGAHSPPLQSHNMDNKAHNERNGPQFSFAEIKRKLRHAMGKERQGISPDRMKLKYSSKHQHGNNGDKGCSGENFGWSSPDRNHFYTERFLKSSPSCKNGEPVGKLKDSSSAAINETCQGGRFGGSNIYIEAKKHLSEMLKNEDENPEPVTGELPKSLGRILSLPEYNGSPCCSPRKYGDDIFITSQIRFSPRSIVKNDVNDLLVENHSNHPSPRRQTLEIQPCISDSNSEDRAQSLDTKDNSPLINDQEYPPEIQSFIQDTVVSEVQSSHSAVVEIEEMAESRPQEEEKIISVFSKSCGSLIIGDIEKEDPGEVDNTEIVSQFFKESSPSFKSPLFGKGQIISSPAVSPSRCPVSSGNLDSDCAIDKPERHSPISVLEPLFTDDDICPPSTISQPVEKEIQPRHIHFEEQSSGSNQGICTRISLEDEESAFEYVEAVLLGSGLNCDEFLSRWLSMYEILYSSLFDEVELFSSRPHHDQKLLFDCANEALKEVCETYFRCFNVISHVKLYACPPPKGLDLINEIWQQVECHLFQSPQPHSLNQLVKTDMARSRKWMNLQSDIEIIVFETGETIFIELVEEIVLSFVDDTSECEFPMPQAEHTSL